MVAQSKVLQACCWHPTSECSPSVSRRDAGLKTLCVWCSEPF